MENSNLLPPLGRIEIGVRINSIVYIRIGIYTRKHIQNIQIDFIWKAAACFVLARAPSLRFPSTFDSAISGANVYLVY